MTTRQFKTARRLPAAFYRSRIWRYALSALLAVSSPLGRAQESATRNTPQNPAQIELLETKVRFETNGDSRKEVHALVKINNELGVRQFARLNFDFNRSFQSVEIPLARITHVKGGTSEILSSAITDNPNPAVVNFPAYQDVRVKSIRILGLAPGDTLEYRVITTTTHPPLAPDFWLEHSFDRTGVVSHEIFEVDLPLFGKVHLKSNPATPPASITKPGDEDPATTYRWDLLGPAPPLGREHEDIALSTFQDWQQLSLRLGEVLMPFSGSLDKVFHSGEQTKESGRAPSPESKRALELTHSLKTDAEKVRSIYEFVSQKVRTVDLPLGSTGFLPRPPAEILSSGYATPEDKFVLLASMARGLAVTWPVLTGPFNEVSPPLPSIFDNLLVFGEFEGHRVWMDPSLEIAPFGLVRSKDGDCGFVPEKIYHTDVPSEARPWIRLPHEAAFPATQRVDVEAEIKPAGELKARVRYAMRGENELVLRLAFHRAPKEKWNEVAQLLALSDGFRGKVTSVTASDPYETRDPFTVEYEVVQPKFVDWTKTPVRIPAILPLLGLPDPPPEPGKTPIELGTPLDVHTSVTLHLPPGTSVEAPAGTNVERDYATFSSQYASAKGAITASRHIHFIERQIPADRAADYNAFLHAVQSDQAQRFTLFPAPRRDSARSDANPGPPRE